MKPRAPAKLRLRQRRSQIKLKVASRRSHTADAEREDPYPDDESNTMKLSHAFFVVLVLHLVLIGGIFGFNYIKARQIPSLLRPHQTSATAKPVANTTPGRSKETANATAESPVIPGESPLTTAPTEKLQASTMTPSSKFRTHRVAQGETIQRIAVAYGVTVAQIEKANSGLPIVDGQLLRIPPRTGMSSLASPTPPQTKEIGPETRKLTAPPSLQTPVLPALSAESTVTAQPQKTASDPASEHKDKASESELASSHAIHGAKGGVQKVGNQVIYTVVSGDNPYSIARRFRVNYTKLIDFNHIKDPTKLQIGTKLKIPPRKES